MRLDLSDVTHLDRTSRGAAKEWARQRRKEGASITIELPPDADDFEGVGSH